MTNIETAKQRFAVLDFVPDGFDTITDRADSLKIARLSRKLGL